MSKVCSKCGSLIDDDAVFCTNCGAPQSTIQQPIELENMDSNGTVPDFENVSGKKSSGKRLVIITFSILAVIVVLSMVGRIVHNNSVSQTANEPQQEVGTADTSKADTQEEDVTDAALAVLNKTSAMDSKLLTAGVVKDVSLGTVLNDMFEKPQVEVEKWENSGAIITISGKFRRSPDQGYNSNGKISFQVGLHDSFCMIHSDPNKIYPDGIQYYALCMVGYY